jgi:hypothetical protein
MSLSFKAFRYSNIDFGLERGDKVIVKFPVEYKDDYDMDGVKVEMQTIMILKKISSNRTELMNLWILSTSESDF